MPDSFQSPAGWSPPGAQFQNRGSFGRTAIGTVVGLIVTPIGIGIAAHGSLTTSRWWDSVDRWSAPGQSVLGAILLLLVAVLAAYSPAATMIAGLIWGIIPGIIQILFPDDTFRLIGNIPGLTAELHVALHAWLASGMVLIVGTLLFGAGVVATLKRR
ncbi:hypothetical protein GV794_19370 [Nocardia cyriacigeorgica]|uniref:Uncharacterized protein n=1 Tax=Nocardia cyriacigeorgica TaxID=135487 RepID=A0A6P1D9Y2_9NOCA|nr:hypothetical protein [Nocardia cyriacigeorgica]NEW46044.1 hypothetical protein [Nocardia cyriacigeorgica]NEW53237.1 hypothetical protein [Nocardia cyriacigeorgica]NEW57800.1 hypothetical protein [Nocardia cyriacigeorgica]